MIIPLCIIILILIFTISIILVFDEQISFPATLLAVIFGFGSFFLGLKVVDYTGNLIETTENVDIIPTLSPTYESQNSTFYYTTEDGILESFVVELSDIQLTTEYDVPTLVRTYVKKESQNKFLLLHEQSYTTTTLYTPSIELLNIK